MIFSNPYFTVIAVLSVISLAINLYKDGEYLPPGIKYNFNKSLTGTIIQLALIYGAVWWATTH